MKRIFTIGFFVVLCSEVNAQFARPDTVSIRSVSGQFVAHGARQHSPSAVPPDLATNLNCVELEPALLTVSGERIKQALCRELGDASPWRGKIHLVLRPAHSGDDPVNIVAERFRDGWTYRVGLPQVVERQRFVRALVHSILVEMANRKAGDRSAEIPLWLTEGLTQHLLNSSEIQIIFPPPRWAVHGLEINPMIIEARRQDPLESARRSLRERPPLTLEELSWPTDEKMADDLGEAYRRSAQLFVTELLRLKNGRDCLRAMLGELASCYNWQTAFFRAFHTHFARQLDLEKWWALQLVNFTGRDLGQLWTVEESWRKLDQIVRTPVEVRRAANELPAHAEVTLQSIIREWDTLRQTPVLNSKLRELELARSRIAPEIAGLAEEYRQAITSYLHRRDQVGLVFPVSKLAQPTVKPIVRDAVKQLDALDVKRIALRPEANPVAATTSEGKPPQAR